MVTMVTLRLCCNGNHGNLQTCSVYGDPHFLTFDGFAYDFMGECHYVLAMDCLYARWIIYGQLERCSADNVRGSCLRYYTEVELSICSRIMKAEQTEH